MRVPRGFFGLRQVKLLMCLALAGFVGCGGEASDGTDPIASGLNDGDGEAGTGSAGGNPLIIGFEAADSPTRSVVQPPTVRIGRIEVFRPDMETGAGADVGGGASQELDFDSARDGVLAIDVRPNETPCALLLQPPEGEALLTLRAAVQSQEVSIAFTSLDAGLIFDIPNPALLDDALMAAFSGEEVEDAAALDPVRLRELQNLFVIIDLGNFLGAIEPLALLGAIRELGAADGDPLSDAELTEGLRSQLRSALLGAIVIYLDPTPGDGELSEEDRTSEQVIATVRLNE